MTMIALVWGGVLYSHDFFFALSFFRYERSSSDADAVAFYTLIDTGEYGVSFEPEGFGDVTVHGIKSVLMTMMTVLRIILQSGYDTLESTSY